MPSAELTSLRGTIRNTLLDIWSEWGTWRAHNGQGLGDERRILVKVQWKNKMLLEQYSGSELEAAAVYLSRDEDPDSERPGVRDPSMHSVLELDSEPNRPLTFRGDVLDKSEEGRIKIVMERNRRIVTGGR